jgi:hypothetical protein
MICNIFRFSCQDFFKNPKKQETSYEIGCGFSQTLNPDTSKKNPKSRNLKKTLNPDTSKPELELGPESGKVVT